MITKEVQSWQDQTALTRYGLIAPLLDETLDTAAKTKLRSEISEKTGVSTRTIYRYESQFLSDGFQGLRPQAKQHNYSKQLPENFPELLEQAIQLKKEVPKRSVAKIIWILELEGRVAPGVLKRSTTHMYTIVP